MEGRGYLRRTGWSKKGGKGRGQTGGGFRKHGLSENGDKPKARLGVGASSENSKEKK